MFDNRFRRLRGMLGTAVTWGAAWAAVGGAIVTAVALFDTNPGIESLIERLGLAMIAGIAWAIRFGIAGAVVGGVFSSVIRLSYRGRRLADISPLRFGMLGAVVGGVGVPLYLQTMNVLSGDGPIPWGLVLDDAPWAAAFGAAAAAGSILLARRADALSHEPHPDSLETMDELDGLPGGEQTESPLWQRSRSTQY